MKIESIIEKYLNILSIEWIDNVLSKDKSIHEKVKKIRETKKNHFVITSTHPHTKDPDWKRFESKVYELLEKAGWKGKKNILVEDDDGVDLGGGVESSISVESSSTDRSSRG